MDVHQRIHRDLLRLVPDLLRLEVGDARKLHHPPWMDLHVEVLRREPDALVVSLTHYGESNGDLMADPDMEVRVYTRPDWKRAEALTFQNDWVGLYRVVYPEPGRVNLLLQHDLNAFLARWLTNLLEQHRKVSRGGLDV